jgi:hypothetical protein
MPLPCGSLRLVWPASQPENLFFQSEPSTTLSMHSAQAHAADAQIVRRHRVGLDDCLRRISAGSSFSLFGDLVELNFQREARLRRAVSALGAARRLVGETRAPWNL